MQAARVRKRRSCSALSARTSRCGGPPPAASTTCVRWSTSKRAGGRRRRRDRARRVPDRLRARVDPRQEMFNVRDTPSATGSSSRPKSSRVRNQGRVAVVSRSARAVSGASRKKGHPAAKCYFFVASFRFFGVFPTGGAPDRRSRKRPPQRPPPLRGSPASGACDLGGVFSRFGNTDMEGSWVPDVYDAHDGCPSTPHFPARLERAGSDAVRRVCASASTRV